MKEPTCTEPASSLSGPRRQLRLLAVVLGGELLAAAGQLGIRRLLGLHRRFLIAPGIEFLGLHRLQLDTGVIEDGLEPIQLTTGGDELIQRLLTPGGGGGEEFGGGHEFVDRRSGEDDPRAGQPASHVELHRLFLDPGLDLIQILGVAGHRARHGLLFPLHTIDFDHGVFVLVGRDLERCLGGPILLELGTRIGASFLDLGLGHRLAGEGEEDSDQTGEGEKGDDADRRLGTHRREG